MKSRKEIERTVGRAPVHSSPAVNQAVLGHLLEELAALKRGTGDAARSPHWISVVKKPMVGAAAAALVLLILFGVFRIPHRTARPQPAARWQSAADLLTVGHLNAAHRRGGLDELDRQCDRAARKLGGPRERISVEELIEELQGS